VKSLRVLFCTAILALPTPSTARERGDDVLAAYRSNPAVAAEIRQLRSRNYESADLESTRISRSCGFRGCQHRTLVIHTFRRGGRTPDTRSILALVHVREPGRVERVELVDLERAHH
jgi:hypothetical protein